MKILLDTCAALWWWSDSPALSEAAREAMADRSNDIFFSAASACEIFQKARLGRLELPGRLRDDFGGTILAEGWSFLPISVTEAMTAASMDHAHRDPFDRLLAAQAIAGSLSLVSPDAFFRELQLDLVWQRADAGRAGSGG
ncbi:MAG: type II toxin-antitoxin system VapC family toxin [Verrucomicrobiales bacterium]